MPPCMPLAMHASALTLQITSTMQVPPALYSSVGSLMGRVSTILARLQHKGLERQHDWSYETAAETIQCKLPLLEQGVLAPDQM